MKLATFGSICCLAAAVQGLPLGGAVLAHPHVWVAVETTVVYDKGAVAALKQRWVFDEFYSAMAIEGLDTNNDGVYDRAELAELTKVNIEGLKEFNYFTTARLGEQALEFDAPTESYMEYLEGPAPGPDPEPQPAEAPKAQQSFWSKLTGAITGSKDGQGAPVEKPKLLSLSFTLPLKQPVLAEAEGFQFAVHDTSFYIWFDLAKDKPVQLSEGAPPGCKATIAVPQRDAQLQQQLSEAFKPGAAGVETGGVAFNFGAAKTVALSCTK